MASGKETPRQKMIGMMYLVLTALLALNVSKEILNAFVVVNESLGETTNTFSARNEKLYSEFNLAKSVDPLRVTANWEKAQQVKKNSLELDNYINKLKKELIMKTEGLEASVADTLQLAFVKNKEDNTITTHLMIGESEDGSKGYSRVLKNKILGFKALLDSFIDKKDKNKVDIGLAIENPKNSEENENWELYNFYNTPVAAAVTILSKLQNDVKNAESVTLDYLLKQFDTDIVKFDTIAPKVIPQSNYVMLGEDYKADVFIAAFSKTQKPEVLTREQENAKFDTLPVSQGIGKYSFKTLREGIFKWGGKISLKSSSGKSISYPFESEFIVAKPAINVSADKMNVLYMGVENPVTISVPGIPTERISPAINTGALTTMGKGKYLVTGVKGSVARISVTATLENGETRNMGISEFRVKQLPTPNAAIDDYEKLGTISKGKVQSMYFLKAVYEKNFDFKLNSPISSFTIEIINSSGVAPGYFKGYKLASNPDVAKFLSHIRPGDRIIFADIKASSPDGTTRTLNDLTFKVN